MPENTKAKKKPEYVSPLSKLIPADMLHVFDGAPIGWLENKNDYDCLAASIYAKLDPKCIVEALLVRDIIDCVWEARRLKRIKCHAIEAEIPEAAWQVMGLESGLTIGNDKPGFLQLVRGASQNSKPESEIIHNLCVEKHVTSDTLEYEAHKRALETTSATALELERIDRRRERLLKQLMDRRTAIAAMAKTLPARDEVFRSLASDAQGAGAPEEGGKDAQ